MIAANKRLLKATLTEGVLSIQQNLIDLYTANLSAMGTQAALIGGFAFAAVQEDFNRFMKISISICITYFIKLS